MKEITAKVAHSSIASTTSVRLTERTGRTDFKTQVGKDMTLREEVFTRREHLSKAAFEQLQADYPDQNLKANFVRKQLKWFQEQVKEGKPILSLDWSRKQRVWEAVHQIYGERCKVTHLHQQLSLGKAVLQAPSWKTL